MAEFSSAVFFVLWIALGIAGFHLFTVKRNAAFKKRYFPAYVIGAGILFFAFVAATSRGDVRVLLFMGPAVVLITLLNLRGTRFCSQCGRTSHDAFPLSRARFCSKCGAPLEDSGS